MGEYQYLQKKENVFISNMEKAKYLSRFLRLQLPTAWTNLDSTNTITHKNVSVNSQNENSVRSSPEIVKDVRKSGVQATKSLIKNIRQLDALNGRANSMRDICSAYKSGCAGLNQEQKDTIEQIAKECWGRSLQECSCRKGGGFIAKNESYLD